MTEQEQTMQFLQSYLNQLTREQRKEIRVRNARNWLRTMMNIADTGLSPEQIDAIVDGKQVRDATIEIYQYAESCRAIRKMFLSMKKAGKALTLSMLRWIHQTLLGLKEPAPYRDRTYIIPELHAKTLAPAQIPEMLRLCIEDMRSEEHKKNPFRGAVHTHEAILWSWPYEKYSDVLAYTAMSFEIFSAGFPLPTMFETRLDHLMMSYDFAHQNGSTQSYEEALIRNLGNALLPVR